MKKIYFLLFTCFTLITAKAQVAYDFAASSGTFTELVGGTSPTFVSSDPAQYSPTDEGYANSLPIGFTFNYNGNPYTTFHMNSNGFIGLGAAFTAGDVYWRNGTGSGLAAGPINGAANDKTSSRPIIAPLWDDMDMGSTTNMTYATSGTAPNRVLTVQWKEVLWVYTATNPVVSFQIKLYEQNGKIEFIYRSEAGTAASPTASVGITAAGTGSNNFMSVSALTTSATASKTTETNNINAKPATGLTFTFTSASLPAQDVFVQGWLNAPPTSCHTTPQTITVRLQNVGSAAINANAVSLNLTSTGANTGINLSNTNSASIAAGATQDVVFTGLNLNAVGATTLRVIATLTGDASPANDTGRITLNTALTTSTFPVAEGAENATFNFGWLRALAGTNAWGLRTGGYRNPNLTSNTADSLYPQSGNRYFLFDSYNAPAGTRSVLHSDCFSMPALNAGREHDVDFWMSHDSSFATFADSLYLIVTTDKGLNWTRLQGFRRYDPTFTVPGWKKESVKLSAYAGQTIMLGFEGVSKFGNVIGLDNVEVRANLTLPVIFESFTGRKEGNNNVLSWTTSFEQNNNGFEILRSADGIKFSSIGFVSSKNNNGNSNTNTNYTLVDNKILAGTNYYQLKQIDKDGKTSLSSIVVLKSNLRKLEIASIYPNPASNQLNIVISSDKEEKVTLAITDIAGRVVKSQSTTASIGSSNLLFNIQDLSKGTYIIKVTSNSSNEILMQKFVKQ